jgi:hypothetical protein
MGNEDLGFGIWDLGFGIWDFILIFALVMLPAVLLFSYYQENSETGILAKMEKFFYPNKPNYSPRYC